MRGKDGPRRVAAATLVTAAVASASGYGHEHTLEAYEARKRAERAAAQLEAGPGASAQAGSDEPGCRLRIELVDAETGRPLPGVVRIKQLPYGAPIALPGLIRRGDWYAIDRPVTVPVPATTLRIEAFHGLDTRRAKRVVDLRDRSEEQLRIPLTRFYDLASRGLRAGNTHLHLKGIDRRAADRYLRVVPRSDALDLVYVSNLRRLSAEHTYVTNDYTTADLSELSRDGVLFDNGIEHRHNFDGGPGAGYGHVLLLHLKELIRPISIGPDLMGSGTDAPALRPGIEAARRSGGRAIWSHNAWGSEDVPSWVGGVLDAQNIFDGGNVGSYADTYYRYLDVGLKVPFSTGSDWFIEDFSRAYVPVEGELTSEKWLSQLVAGRSYITNGTFLELEVDGRPIGDTIALAGPSRLSVRARGLGRNAFRGIELVHDGSVVHSVPSRAADGHFEAQLRHVLAVDRPGWVALRLPPDESEDNDFDFTLYAHTSPIYVEIGGRRPYRADVAAGLIAEMEASIAAIRAQGVFADGSERESVLAVYRRAIEQLRAASARQRLEGADRASGPHTRVGAPRLSR